MTVGTSTAIWLLASLLLPLLCAPLLLRGTGGLAQRLAPWTLVPALALAWLAPVGSALELPWLLLGTQFGLDAAGQAFLRFTTPLWCTAAFYARAYMAHDARRGRFMALFLATAGANLVLILAQDVASFYLFFALMTFAAYGLVVHTGSETARRAGRVYLTMAVIGELLLFAGFVLGADAAGSTALAQVRTAVAAPGAQGGWVVALILAGFGIKGGVLGLHIWLPLAHPVAPTPASAVLSGVIIKAGLLGWMRLLPLGEATLTGPGWLLVAAGLVAAFYGVAVGLTQHNAKTLLAYSSISQMGFMTLAIGAGLVAPEAWPALLGALLVYALHHALAKGALFLGVGVAAGTATGRAARLWIMAGLLLPALVIAGLPWSSGALAKLMLKDALAALPPPATGPLLWLLALAAVGSSLLMARLLFIVWRDLQRDAAHAHDGLIGPWVLCLAAGAGMAGAALHAQAPALAQTWLTAGALWSAAWPLMAGAAVALFVLWRAPAWLNRLPVVPAGDLLFMAGAALRALARLAGPLRRFGGRSRRAAIAGLRQRRAGFAQTVRALTPPGGWHGLRMRWRLPGMGLLVLVSLFFIVLSGAGAIQP